MDDSGDKMENGKEKPEQETVETLKRSVDVAKPEAPESNGSSESSGSPESKGAPHPHEELMDDYPLRKPGEDPVWSVRVVKGWMWFLAFTTGGILLLIVLGLFYD